MACTGSGCRRSDDPWQAPRVISLVLMLLTACAGTSRLATRSEPEAEEAAEAEEQE